MSKSSMINENLRYDVLSMEHARNIFDGDTTSIISGIGNGNYYISFNNFNISFCVYNMSIEINNNVNEFNYLVSLKLLYLDQNAPVSLCILNVINVDGKRRSLSASDVMDVTVLIDMMSYEDACSYDKINILIRCSYGIFDDLFVNEYVIIDDIIFVLKESTVYKCLIYLLDDEVVQLIITTKDQLSVNIQYQMNYIFSKDFVEVNKIGSFIKIYLPMLSVICTLILDILSMYIRFSMFTNFGVYNLAVFVEATMFIEDISFYTRNRQSTDDGIIRTVHLLVSDLTLFEFYVKTSNHVSTCTNDTITSYIESLSNMISITFKITITNKINSCVIMLLIDIVLNWLILFELYDIILIELNYFVKIYNGSSVNGIKRIIGDLNIKDNINKGDNCFDVSQIININEFNYGVDSIWSYLYQIAYCNVAVLYFMQLDFVIVRDNIEFVNSVYCIICNSQSGFDTKSLLYVISMRIIIKCYIKITFVLLSMS